MNHYRTIQTPGQAELVIQKSRFLTYVFPVDTEKTCQEYLSSIRKKHYDATHHCSAYILGLEQNSQKADDDGEPSGTAGRPILEILKKQALTNVLVVVTRYFGGIKLGANGLIRAYGKSALSGISAAQIVDRQLCCRYLVEIPYSLQGSLENRFHLQNYIIENRTFTSQVTFHLLITLAQQAEFEQLIQDATSGQAKLSQLEPTYISLPASLL